MSDQSETGVSQPREVRRGHLTQTRARLEDDHVHVVRQKRKHHFRRGMSDFGPDRLVWGGSLSEAEQLHEILEALLYDEDEVNYADA